jgi:hypothetical protein
VNDLRQNILEEVALSRDIVRDGTEVVPRFTIRTRRSARPHGAASRRREAAARPAVEGALFMIWKAASAFIVASELSIFEGISVIAVSRTEILGALQRIKRSPLTFSEPEWFGREHVGKEMIDLLPPPTLTVTHDELAFMGRAFEVGTIPGITWVKP